MSRARKPKQPCRFCGRPIIGNNRSYAMLAEMVPVACSPNRAGEIAALIDAAFRDDAKAEGLRFGAEVVQTQIPPKWDVRMPGHFLAPLSSGMCWLHRDAESDRRGVFATEASALAALSTAPPPPSTGDEACGGSSQEQQSSGSSSVTGSERNPPTTNTKTIETPSSGTASASPAPAAEPIDTAEAFAERLCKLVSYHPIPSLAAIAELVTARDAQHAATAPERLAAEQTFFGNERVHFAFRDDDGIALEWSGTTDDLIARLRSNQHAATGAGGVSEATLIDLAAKIASDLFTDATGAHAGRLVMEAPNEHLGFSGWCEQAVADRVLTALRSRLSPARSETGGGK